MCQAIPDDRWSPPDACAKPLGQALDRLKRRPPLSDSDHQQAIELLAFLCGQPVKHLPAQLPVRQSPDVFGDALQSREGRQLEAGANQCGYNRIGEVRRLGQNKSGFLSRLHGTVPGFFRPGTDTGVFAYGVIWARSLNRIVVFELHCCSKP